MSAGNGSVMTNQEQRRAYRLAYYRVKSREWRRLNPEKAREKVRAWRLRNPEKAKAIKLRWLAKVKDDPVFKARQLAKNRRYRALHPEKVREYERRAVRKRQLREIAEYGAVLLWCPSCRGRMHSRAEYTRLCDFCRELEADEISTVPNAPQYYRTLAEELDNENAAVLIAAIEHGKNLAYRDWTPSDRRVIEPGHGAPAWRYETPHEREVEERERIELPSAEEIARGTLSIERSAPKVTPPTGKRGPQLAPRKARFPLARIAEQWAVTGDF